MTEEKKDYWVDEEKYSAVPGSDIHKALAQCFSDYFYSKKKHRVSIRLNDVTVTLERKRF